MLGDHARREKLWIGTLRLAVEPPVRGELVEQLVGGVGEHHSVVARETVHGFTDETLAVRAERKTKFLEVRDRLGGVARAVRGCGPRTSIVSSRNAPPAVTAEC